MSRSRRAAGRAALLVAGLVASIPAYAQNTPQQKLHDVERQLKQGRRQKSELNRNVQDLGEQIRALRDSEVRAAAAAQMHETELDRLGLELKELMARKQAEAENLQRKRAAEAQLLMALARLAYDPPEALLLSPTNPVDAVRSGLLLGHAVPPLVARARILGAEITRFESLRAQIESTMTKRRAEAASLAHEKAQIVTLIDQKRALQQRTQEGLVQLDRQQATLAARASDLRDLIARLEAARRKGQGATARPPAAGTPRVVTTSPVASGPNPPHKIQLMAQAKGRLAVPTSGLLIVRFGAMEPGGMTSKGLTFETRPGAQVVAPFNGQVLYAGPFKGYGDMLIIGHGDGYYSVLAGLDRIEQHVGQWLVTGEPVGVMPQDNRRPRLYLELRHNGQPINPLPWLAIRDEKVNG